MNDTVNMLFAVMCIFGSFFGFWTARNILDKANLKPPEMITTFEGFLMVFCVGIGSWLFVFAIGIIIQANK